MQEGLYKAEFETVFGSGTGVFHFSDGKLRGGNSALYYHGTYELTGSTMHATFKAKRHSQDVNIASVFGMDDITVIMEGHIKDDIIMIDGVAEEVPDMPMHGKLTLLSD